MPELALEDAPARSRIAHADIAQVGLSARLRRVTGGEVIRFG